MNFNKAYLGGRLTADPELKQTQSGTAVTSFTVAVDRPKDKDGNKTADFVNCVAWKTTAENITKYFHKGSNIFIEGAIQVRPYEDKNGNKRTATEIIVNRFEFIDKAENKSDGKDLSYIPEQYAAPQFEDVADGDDLPF